MPKTQHPTMAEMDAALHQTLDQVDALKAENARLQDKLDGFMEAFERGGSLGILQMIGADKSLPIEIRMRAAGLAVPYEKPKLSMTATVNHRPLFDILEEARLKERKVIEAPSAERKTVLGEGQGHHGAWHPIDSDKGDPAA
jgi:hypothetical protein